MALIVKDRVKETTTTTGTGTVTLAGASTGFRSFADIGNANTTYYCISGGSQFEVGLGTYTASGTTLSRDTVLSNSLGTTAKIDFSAGSKDVFCTYPASTSVTNPNPTDIVVNGITIGAGANARYANIAIGNSSLVSITTGTGNTAVGEDTLVSLKTGTQNTAVGLSALYNATGTANPANNNTAIGVSAGYNITSADNNVCIGHSSGQIISTGGSNTVVGTLAGNNIDFGQNNVYVGANTPVSRPTEDFSNEIVIGANADGNGPNTTTIGNSSTTNTYLRGALNVSGALGLTGSDTVNQSIATAQTGGNLTIGGTNGSGTITLGRSTNAQTTDIQAGATASGLTKTLNIGTGGLAGSTTSITIGSTTGTSTTTLNGKTSGRIVPRVSTTTSDATPTINTDNTDQYGLTAQAVDITSFTTNLSGTPTDGQKLWIYIVGTAARAITWGASFESSTATLPTTTVTTNRLDIGFVWNAATSKWRCVAVA